MEVIVYEIDWLIDWLIRIHSTELIDSFELIWFVCAEWIEWIESESNNDSNFKYPFRYTNTYTLKHLAICYTHNQTIVEDMGVSVFSQSIKYSL